jgi:hypothetical protein
MPLTAKHLDKHYDEVFEKKYGNSMTDLYILVGVTTVAFLTITILSLK